MAQEALLQVIEQITRLPRDIALIILGHLPGYTMFTGQHTVHRWTIRPHPQKWLNMPGVISDDGLNAVPPSILGLR